MAVAILTITVGLVLPGIIAHGGRADLRRRRAPGHRHARRPDAGDAGAQHRRPRRGQGTGRHRPRRRALARRGRRAGALLQPDAGRGRPRRRGARRRPRGPARDRGQARAQPRAADRRRAPRPARARGRGPARPAAGDRDDRADGARRASSAPRSPRRPTAAALGDGPSTLDGPAVPIGPRTRRSASCASCGPRAAPRSRPTRSRSSRRRANVLADAIERRRAEEEMRRQGLHDPLTGLPNRTLFMDRLVARAQPGRAPPELGRRAVHRPRPLQARQRLARPRRRRRAPEPARQRG